LRFGSAGGQAKQRVSRAIAEDSRQERHDLLVSVTERTREIGLRMAIGARRTHVLLQFLAESVILSVTGGIAGIIVGVAFSEMISIVAGWPAPISLAAVAGGFLFSAAVGIFFGYYPARKAASLDPIEALRYE
jgi:macrolide transport system ATP-binding/permease protein